MNAYPMTRDQAVAVLADRYLHDGGGLTVRQYLVGTATFSHREPMPECNELLVSDVAELVQRVRGWLKDNPEHAAP